MLTKWSSWLKFRSNSSSSEPAVDGPGPVAEYHTIDSLPSVQRAKFKELEEPGTSNASLERMRDLNEEGYTVKDLLQRCPHDLITILKDVSVVKDSVVIKAFGGGSMITRGSHSLEDPQWEQNWKDILLERSKHSDVDVGWEDKVTLGAYAIHIKGITKRSNGPILQLLLQKHSSGATSQRIWELPSVAAIINYHWENWAQPYLFMCCAVFICWMLCYVLYMGVYIEYDKVGEDRGSLFYENSTGWALLDVLSLLCIAFMFPFAIELFLAHRSQGRKFLHTSNLLSMLAVGLQIYITICQLLNWRLDRFYFKLALVTQCVTLFTKLQYFGKAMLRGAYFSEIFLSVMYDSRYLLYYIIYSSLSASLCLAVLYKNEVDDNDEASYFSSLKRSLMTTYEVVFGQFEMDYVLGFEHEWIKYLFFFGFQIMMTITVLNLLIAVMSTSYRNVSKNLGAIYNHGRAIEIDKLDVLGIPKLLLKKELHPYIHFLTVETASLRSSLDELINVGPSTEDFIELENRIATIEDKMKILLSRHEENMQTLMSKVERLLDAS